MLLHIFSGGGAGSVGGPVDLAVTDGTACAGGMSLSLMQASSGCRCATFS